MARVARAGVFVVLTATAAAASCAAPAPEVAAGAAGNSVGRSVVGDEEGARRILELLRWKEPYLNLAESSLVGSLDWDRGSWAEVARFRQVATFEPLEDRVLAAWTAAMDPPTADAVISFLESEPGRRFVAASIDAAARVPAERYESWLVVNLMKASESARKQPPDDEEESEAAVRLYERHRGRRLLYPEISAISTLRAVAQAQATSHFRNFIDVDDNMLGEAGTFGELLGQVGARAGVRTPGPGDEWSPLAVDFSKREDLPRGSLLPSRYGTVDTDGILRMRGYCFRIYLPDAGKKAGFTHEAGPADSPRFEGGTASVEVSVSESKWCAYAWPEEWGRTGRHAFFINQTGDVLLSENGTARWEGSKAPPGNSAFLGDGITSPVASGTRGRDGEVWEVCY